MLEVLHDTFAWRQAKIVVVPRLMLVVNFLCELVRWPSRWRDFWATLNPEDAKAAAGGGSWRRLKKALWDPTALDKAGRLKKLLEAGRRGGDPNAATLLGKLHLRLGDPAATQAPTH